MPEIVVAAIPFGLLLRLQMRSGPDQLAIMRRHFAPRGLVVKFPQPSASAPGNSGVRIFEPLGHNMTVGFPD
jgi:hypothetical protein